LLQQLDGVTEFVIKGSAIPAFDIHCPLLSLPLAFKTNLGTIPHAQKYLASDSNKVSDWAGKLGEKTAPRIGLVWSGRREHRNDQNRSILLSALSEYLPAGPQYVCLQNQVRIDDQAILESRRDIAYFGHALEDFSDTAALCELMDVVISVDTSVAHLSAALGKTTWVLLPCIPDWRWLLERDDSPWYPSARLYRQEPAGSWKNVFIKVENDLLRLDNRP